MPAKNAIKEYLPNSFYHIYNRGVEKRDIFLDDQDFTIFLSYLKTYLLPKDVPALQAILGSSQSSFLEKERAKKLLALNNFSRDVKLQAFSLLPNHFHLLIKQAAANSMDRLIQSLASRYSGYFNKKYHRVGKLFQGVYKAVLVNSDEQLLHLSRYIHLNPFLWASLPLSRWSEQKWPSSLPNFLGQTHCDWIRPETILAYFKKNGPNDDYFHFLQAQTNQGIVASLTLEDAE